MGKPFSFAHLLGFGAKKAEDEERDEDMKRDDETDEEYEARKAKKAEDDKKDPEDETDKDEEDEKDELEEGEEKERKEQEKAKAAAFAEGAAAERARCAAIFGSKPAASRPDMAAHLAFNTDLDAKAAVAALDAAAVGHNPKGSLANRMTGVQVPAVGTDGGQRPDPNSPAAQAAAIVAAGKKARGEK